MTWILILQNQERAFNDVFVIWSHWCGNVHRCVSHRVKSKIEKKDESWKNKLVSIIFFSSSFPFNLEFAVATEWPNDNIVERLPLCARDSQLTFFSSPLFYISDIGSFHRVSTVSHVYIFFVSDFFRHVMFFFCCSRFHWQRWRWLRSGQRHKEANIPTKCKETNQDQKVPFAAFRCANRFAIRSSRFHRMVKFEQKTGKLCARTADMCVSS